MSTSPEYSVLQSLLKDAVDKYKSQVGTSLIENQLATQLGTCDDVQSVSALLEERVQAFRDFLERDRHPKMKQSIRRTVHVLHTIFTGLGGAVQVGHGIDSIPFPPVKLIFAAIGILLATVKDVRASYDALLHLFESIGNFVQRLDIYTKIPPTTVMTEILVKIIVELLSTLALATKQIKQGPLKKFGMKLLGENEVEGALQRLDRLTHDEARATAVQTLEVVYRLVQNVGLVMNDSKASNDGVRQVLEMMQEMTSQANKEKRDQMQQNLRRWLSPSDPWKNHNIASDAHHNGTAKWLIESDTFAEWKSSGSLLWIRGKPGAGKTILCSTIINNIEGLRKSGLASLLFFYCDFRDDEKKDRRSLLSSLLFQLCDQSDSYCKILSDFYSEHRNGSQDPSDRARTQCLKDVLKCSGQAPIYIIIDALDECPKASARQTSRENVLRLVEELVGLHLTNLRICVTSRPEADIETVLNDLTPRLVSLHDERGQKEDIIDYITSVVNTDPKMKRWKAADKELVIGTLSKKANGMFRWVSCQVDYLRPCLPGRIRRALDELPETLDGTYERTLEDIDEANWEYAHRIFQCLTVASRPLKVKELAEILAFDFEAGEIPKLVTDWRSEDPDETLLSTCSSLISVIVNDENDEGADYQVVQFSHFSVKEFLTSSRLTMGRHTISRYHVLMTPAHTVVTRACLGALLHLDENVSEDTLKDFPLIEYAAEKWVDHAQFDNVSLSVQDGMKLLFDLNKPYFKVWLWIFDPEPSMYRQLGRGRPNRPSQPRGTPLHYAALYGMCDVARFLVVECSQGVNARSPEGNRTPLFLAAKLGHLELTTTLLDHGTDVNARDGGGITPLQMASEGGHLEVVQLLLNHGADASARDKGNRTPLHSLSEESWPNLRLYPTSIGRRNGNHVKVAKLLLEWGVDPNAQDGQNKTALHLASSNGQMEVAEILLDRGVDANARSSLNTIPLHLASRGGHLKIVRMLLDRRADVNARDENYRTPLHCVSLDRSFTSSGEVAELLLELGADPNARDNDDNTPLHLASKNGHVKVAEMLLDRGVDANARNNDNTIPLHLASQGGHLKIVRMLLDRGTDVNARDNNYKTPLDYVSQGLFLFGRDHLEVAELLLELGADPNARDNNENTPLHLASGSGHMKFAEMLLDRGVDANARNNENTIPLHFASRGGHLGIVRMLLDRGADVNARDKNYGTPLHSLSRSHMFKNHLKVAEVLLELGADPNARDNDNNTPLHLASENGHVKLAEMLLDRGVDANARNNDNAIPLHFASQSERLKIVRMLLDRGADVNARDKYYKTPLHCVSLDLSFTSSGDHLEVAELLLEFGADPSARDNDDNTLLHFASKNGHVKVAEMLLDRGVDANARNDDDAIPLHFASEGGNIKIVRMLLDRGADVNARDRNHKNPLHRVLQHFWFPSPIRYHLEVAELLLELGADPNARDDDDNTPLHFASKNGQVKIAEMLLDRGVDPNAQNNDNTIPLHFASQRGDLRIVRMLLDRRADVNARDKNYKTPLHCVSLNLSFTSSGEAAELLLEVGADPNARDNDDNTPLHFALKNGHVKVAEMLLDRGVDANARNNDNTIPLHFASQRGDLRIVRMLLDRRADVNARDNDYKTPLHYVSPDISSLTFRSSGSNLEVAELLLELGADPNARDNDDNTPLHLASKNGHVKVAEMLLDRGVDVNARNNDNTIPLHFASEGGYPKIVRVLLDRGADVNARDKNYGTPLHCVSRYESSHRIKNHLEVAKTLLELGADPNARDSNDNTALHLASQKGHVDIAESLFGRGADPNARNNDNATSLHLASGAGHFKVVWLLLRCRADVNACDNEHHKPFHLAWQSGHRRVIQALLEHRAIEEPLQSAAAVCDAPIQPRRMTL